MTAVIGYTRPLIEVDTSAQDAALRAAGASAVFAETDAPESGNASQLQRCLDALRPGDALVVTEAARLAPSPTKFVRMVAALQARGIGFRSLREPALCTGGPPVDPGEVFAALEALRIELAGVRARRRRGVGEDRPRGRPSVMTPERLAMAHELRRHDRSLAHIAGVLGVSASAVQRALAMTNDQPAP